MCASHLRATIAIVDPRVVVALGSVALRALAGIEHHDLSLRAHVGQLVPWSGRLLVPLYHPGPRAQIHRSFERQKADFRALGATIEQL